MKKGLIIFLLAGISFVAQAQPQSIKGEVMDAQTGEKLPGASIRSLLNDDLGSYADENGVFEILLSPEDTLLISFLGYQDEIIPAASISNGKISVQMKIQISHVQEVEITAERIIAEEFTIRKIKKLEIYTNPGAKADPILAVGSTPSATTTDESANISLRGGSPAETGIFFNNVPINDAVRYSQLNGIGTFSIFNTALIKHVLVYPGNPPLEYGNSTSGIISLHTDETIPEKSSHTISLTLASLGLYSSRKLDERSSLTFFSNYQPSLFIRSVNSQALRNLKKFSSVDLGLHYFRKIARSAILKIFNYSIRESYQFQYNQPTYEGLFKQDKIRNFTVANFRKRIGKTEVSFNQGVSFSKADYRYGITDINLGLRDLFSSFNIQQVNVAGEWKTGISFDHKASTFDGYFPTFEYASGPGHPVTHGTSTDQVNNPEFYGYYKHYLGAKWIAGGGIRKNLAGEKLKDYLSFQGNIHYSPAGQWNVNFSAGKYHKYQLPQDGGNLPVLVSSDQYSIDISCSQNTLESSLSLFFKKSHISETEITTKGVEAYTRYQLTGNMKFQISLTSLDASHTKNEKTEPSPYNIHYFLRGHVEYKIQGTWTITTVFLFRQGSYYRQVSGTLFHNDLQAHEPIYAFKPERLPTYQTIDLSASKIFLISRYATGIAFLSAGNIVNFKNVRSYTYNFDYSERREYLFSRRTVYFGLVVNF